MNVYAFAMTSKFSVKPFQDLIDVVAGSVLTVNMNLGASVAYRAAGAGESTDASGGKLYVRATYVRPTEVILIHYYNLVGIREINLNISSDHFPARTHSYDDSHTLIVLEGINVTVILSDTHGLTNEPFVFQLDAQSGEHGYLYSLFI